MERSDAKKLFYATILAGILNNRDIGGSPEAKINMAIDHGNKLLDKLQEQEKHEPLGRHNLLG